MPQSNPPGLHNVIKAFKNAEYANRKAARAFAQFVDHLNKLGIEVVFEEETLNEKGTQADATVQQERRRQASQ